MSRIDSPLKCGEMSELAEGARLEIVCAVTSGTEGSNPSLSAIYCLNTLPIVSVDTQPTATEQPPPRMIKRP